MATTTPDNIYSPDAGQQYALTQDLLAMADSVQNALTTRALTASVRTYVGTRAERLAFTARDGDIWQETDNPGFTFVFRGSSWTTTPATVVARFRRSDGQLALNPGAATGMKITTVERNTLGAIQAVIAQGAGFRVPVAGTYEVSAEIPVGTNPGWNQVGVLANSGSVAHISGPTLSEYNVPFGYSRLSTQRVIYIPDTSAVLYIYVTSNEGASMRDDGMFTIRKVPDLW